MLKKVERLKKFLLKVCRFIYNSGSSFGILPIVFETIAICIKRFPGTCGRHRKNIESLILSAVVTEDKEVFEAAVLCFSLLPRCGSGGEKHIKHIENWQLLLLKLLKSVNNSCLPFTNPSIDEEEDNNEIKTTDILFLSFSKQEYSCPGLIPILKIHKLLLLLNSLLKQTTNFVVQVPLSILVHTFCEVVKILDVDMERRADIQIEKVILQHHMNNLLTSLILCIGTCCKQFQLSMIPFMSVISRIALRLLMHSDLVSKSKCYNTINHMVDYCFVSFENCSNLSDILNHVLGDVKIVKNIEEDLSRQAEPQKKSKKKNQFAKNYCKDINLAINNKNWININGNIVQNTKSAFKVLHSVISKVGHSSSEETMDLVVSTLLTIYQSLCENMSRQVGQYTSNVTLDYLKTLSKLLHLHSNKFCIPSSILLSIFRAFGFAAHQSTAVSSYCREALLDCDQVLHSSAPQWRLKLLDPIDLLNNNSIELKGNKSQTEVRNNLTAFFML